MVKLSIELTFHLGCSFKMIFIFQVIVDNLKEGENYKITVATMVDGYTTDKHATQVETFADTTQTLLFPLDEGVTIEEAQDEVFKFFHVLFM